MTNLCDLHVLIVDRSDYSGFELRNSFMKAGANTHVVSSFASAAKLVRNTKIDVALVEYSTDSETIAFLRTLSELNIPCVFTSEPTARYTRPRKSEMVAAVQDVLGHWTKPGDPVSMHK